MAAMAAMAMVQDSCIFAPISRHFLGGRWQPECVDRHMCLSCAFAARVSRYPYKASEASAAFAPEQIRAGHGESLAKLDAALSNITFQNLGM